MKMPRQIFNADEFKKLLEKAKECRVVKKEDTVKLKLRTPKMLYVLFTSKEEADKLLKDVKIEVKEIE